MCVGFGKVIPGGLSLALKGTSHLVLIYLPLFISSHLKNLLLQVPGVHTGLWPQPPTVAPPCRISNENFLAKFPGPSKCTMMTPGFRELSPASHPASVKTRLHVSETQLKVASEII